MARGLGLLVAFVVVMAIIAWGITLVVKAVLRWHRQRELARFAPDLLHLHGVPRSVEAMILEQRESLANAARLMHRMREDEFFEIPSVHADPIKVWLDRYRTDQQHYKELNS